MSQFSKHTKNIGLGRGFDALIPKGFDNNILLDEAERIQKITIDLLHPNNDQPRKLFDEEAIGQLASSIKRHGVLQPLIVTPKDDKTDLYTIIAGERRWRAAKKAGLKTIPVIVRSSKELEQLEIALVENVQRVDLSPLEQAESIERLHQQFNLEYAAIAKRLGKADTTVYNTVRLLQLPADAFNALRDKKISEGHARSVLALKDFPDKQSELLKGIIRNGWSVRQAERFVTAVKQSGADKKVVKASVKSETPSTRRLSRIISAPVSIRRMAKGGKLEIGFSSDEELERIIDDFVKKN